MAHVVSVGVYTLLLPLALGITVAAFFIYKAFYDKHNNKVLESGETNKRKWLAPWVLALIILGAQLLLVAGIMFPVSMFMVQPESQETDLELSEENPVLFDISDYVIYQIDESRFSAIKTESVDGITVTVYRNKEAKVNHQYIILGEIDKGSHEAQSVYINYEINDSVKASCLSGGKGNSEFTKTYFKCEVLKDDGVPATISVGVINRYVYEMSSEEENFDKKLELTF